MNWGNSMDDDYRKNQRDRKREVELCLQLTSTGGFCVLCGYHTDPLNIQWHHIAGRKHDDVTIPVCLNCHSSLSRMQNGRPMFWYEENLPPELKMALILRGQSDANQLISIQLRQLSDQMIKDYSEGE